MLALSLIHVLLAAQAANAILDPAHLFPIPVVNGWSTAPSAPSLGASDAKITRVPLSLGALNALNVSSGLTENVVAAPSAPAGTLAFEADYPAGSFNPSDKPRGGFGFYVSGPASFDWTGANEILFSYAVMFPAGFNFVKGGKLPGPYGGTTPELAIACSGGRQDGRDECFDLRLMWRTAGAGEIYAYLPEQPANAVLNNLTGTVTDSDFGTSVARGAYTFATGDWTVVAQRVKLNTPGASPADGELELFVSGKSVIHATQVEIRTSAAAVFRGAHFQTFFGGDTVDWASPTAQSVFFADVGAAVLAPGSSPASGGAPYPVAAAVSTPGSGTSAGAGTKPSSTGGASTAGTGANSSSPSSPALRAVASRFHWRFLVAAVVLALC